MTVNLRRLEPTSIKTGSEQEFVKLLILGGFLQYTFLAVNAVGKQSPTKMPQSLGLRCGNDARSGAVAFVIVGHAVTAATLQWQSGLSTIQRLDLVFLVHAQH